MKQRISICTFGAYKNKCTPSLREIREALAAADAPDHATMLVNHDRDVGIDELVAVWE